MNSDDSGQIVVVSLHWGFSIGGVAKYAMGLQRITEREPISIKSICILPRNRKVDKAGLESLDAAVVPIRSTLDIRWVRRVRDIVRDVKPDCIISHGFNGHFVSALGCSRLGMKPCRIASYHGSYHATTKGRRLVERIYNGFTHWFLRNKAAAILSVAQHCANFLADKGVSREKITVIHNGIPDLLPVPARESVLREWGLSEDHIVIGVVSRLDPVKGLAYLISAFANLVQEHSRIRLVMIGDGSDRQALEAQAWELGIENLVYFAGLRVDIPRCLTALDIFVLPSLAEYHSIGLLEAMRAGLAIVATGVGGNTESVRDEQEGLIVRAADTTDLGRTLERVVGDADLRRRLGEAARARFLAEFTEKVMLERTASWLRQVCVK